MTEQEYKSSLNSAINNNYVNDSSFSNMLESLDSGIMNMISGDLDYVRELEQMKIQNSFNAWQSQLAWERQKENAQSQYQWAVEDMRKAGLNPFLAYSNGGNQVGSVPTTSNSGFSSQNKGRQTSSLIGGILTSLLGGAFKVATTSMMSESMMAQTLQRIQSSKQISNSINQNYLDIERLRHNNRKEFNDYKNINRDNIGYYGSNRNYTDKELMDMFNALKED